MGQPGNENAAAYRGFISCPVWSRRDGEAEVTQRITPGYLDWGERGIKEALAGA